MTQKWSKVGNFINKAFDIVKEGIELFKRNNFYPCSFNFLFSSEFKPCFL